MTTMYSLAFGGSGHVRLNSARPPSAAGRRALRPFGLRRRLLKFLEPFDPTRTADLIRRIQRRARRQRHIDLHALPSSNGGKKSALIVVSRQPQ